MAVDYLAGNSTDGLSLNLYRGEDMVLLAFDIDDRLKKPDFAGFGIQYFIGNAAQPRDVFNFLTFKRVRLAAKAAKKDIALADRASMRSPIQQFRWAHVPSVPLDDVVTYKVSAMFWNGDQPPVAKATTQATIDVHRATRGTFLNVGFTRGFASSQAYERNFPGQRKIIPPAGKSQLDFDITPFAGDGKPYPWLGFEARRILFDFLDECLADPSVSVDVFAYDLSDSEIVGRYEKFKSRLRILIDDSDKHGQPKSDETAAFKRLKISAGDGNVARHHFSGLQHNKVVIAKRKSGSGVVPFAVSTGSTNFSLSGLYIQNNNVLLFRDADIAKFYADAFANAFPAAAGFSGKPVATQWFEKALPDAGTYRFCFSPHKKKSTLSMKPLADAINGAKKSVFYAIAFRGAETGLADDALDNLDPKKLLVMGVANMPGKPKSKTLMVQLPGRGAVPFGPAALTKNLPEPFKSEWTGGGGIHMHHKFVVCDFNGKNPVAFTGSSNLAQGGEEGNGDNLIEIRDPKVVVAYAVQAVSIFDHYGFRNRMKTAEKNPQARDLDEPPAAGKPAWWEQSFKPDDYKCRDRLLFSGALPPQP
jgi:phosphatidylserine/phosphatidylglycerophosphate/cardiolipin synthase-like enzyme